MLLVKSVTGLPAGGNGLVTMEVPAHATLHKLNHTAYDWDDHDFLVLMDALHGTSSVIMGPKHGTYHDWKSSGGISSVLGIQALSQPPKTVFLHPRRSKRFAASEDCLEVFRGDCLQPRGADNTMKFCSEL